MKTINLKIVSVFLCVVFACIDAYLCYVICHPYKNGYEISNYEITNIYTNKIDTIEIKTPINVKINKHKNIYNSKSKFIFCIYGDAVPIYINDVKYFGLEGVGNVRKLNVIETSINK